jgi:hypothetical protein
MGPVLCTLTNLRGCAPRGRRRICLSDRIALSDAAADKALMAEPFPQEINDMLSKLSPRERTIIDSHTA